MIRDGFLAETLSFRASFGVNPPIARCVMFLSPPLFGVHSQNQPTPAADFGNITLYDGITTSRTRIAKPWRFVDETPRAAHPSTSGCAGNCARSTRPHRPSEGRTDQDTSPGRPHANARHLEHPVETSQADRGVQAYPAERRVAPPGQAAASASPRCSSSASTPGIRPRNAV